MKAIIQDEYGSSEVLVLEEIDTPVVKDDEVLVRVQAASVHPGDWLLMTGRPLLFRPGFGLRKPRKRVPGFDFAGTVVSVGENVREFQPGDEVFGEAANGSCAEYVAVSAEKMALKPANLTPTQAAVVPVSGVTALRGLRDAAKVRPGQHVLINGASGGVGTFAVQIAKALGAEVTGVCSARNVEMVQSIGADHVIDYTKEDFTKGGERFDVILDNVANHSLAALPARPDVGGDSSHQQWNRGQSLDRAVGPHGRRGGLVAVREQTEASVFCTGEEERPHRSQRDDRERQDHPGHRTDVLVERDRGGPEPRRRGTRPRKSSHHGVKRN